jgi:thiol-disulfide isomerase/thioredoxin
MKSTDYCPYCKRVTPQIKELGQKLCKRCGKIDKRINPAKLLI